MSDQDDREYVIDIDPRILELLGPSLYTNIYYVLAELIANSYDAMASNVYVTQKEDSIVVEDDGTGMSYEAGDIKKYLNVAAETRSSKEDVYTADGERKKMGRKGIGKLAALSVSEEVLVMTQKNSESSGFVLSRHVGSDHKLKALPQESIKFELVTGDGTSVVMTKPEYGLHKTAAAIKNNLLKIFPLVSEKFKVHIITNQDTIIIDNFDKEIIEGLGALIVLGEEYHHLSKYFDPLLENGELLKEELLKKEDMVSTQLNLKNKNGENKPYELRIKGWIGAYRTTRGRKTDNSDFPDNFISILSNGKLGEYNVLPSVGRNRLPEVYIVGQLHIDLFEETELPDMALSNRQGYKTEDPRYEFVIKYIRETLLTRIVNMRIAYASQVSDEKNKQKYEQQKKNEEELRKKVEEFKTSASNQATQRISDKFDGELPEGIGKIIQGEMNLALPLVGIKKKVDDQKKRILISHTGKDKALADVIYKMLSFNNVSDDDIIYTSCDNEACRVPEGESVFEYLREFFVDSYSDEKIFVIYVTSDDMEKAWFAVTEVGAGWITKSSHKVFNVHDHTPRKPLDTDVEWQTSYQSGNNITMKPVEFDKFIVKILDICKQLSYTSKSKEENEKELKRYASIIST